jgi:hypothetical protein
MEPLGFVTWWLKHQQVIGLIFHLLSSALLGVVFFLALLAGLYLIVGVVKGVAKMRAHPPPVAAIIVLASAVFAGWVLVVTVPSPSHKSRWRGLLRSRLVQQRMKAVLARYGHLRGVERYNASQV